jgi:hypothetical protein
VRGALQRGPRRARIRQVLGGTADLPRARPLTEALEFFQGEAELAEDQFEQFELYKTSHFFDSTHFNPGVAGVMRVLPPRPRPAQLGTLAKTFNVLGASSGLGAPAA